MCHLSLGTGTVVPIILFSSYSLREHGAYHEHEAHVLALKGLPRVVVENEVSNRHGTGPVVIFFTFSNPQPAWEAREKAPDGQLCSRNQPPGGIPYRVVGICFLTAHLCSHKERSLMERRTSQIRGLTSRTSLASTHILHAATMLAGTSIQMGTPSTQELTTEIGHRRDEWRVLLAIDVVGTTTSRGNPISRRFLIVSTGYL